MENNQHVFQVNLKGMISLLSEHIYSNPSTFVRELLQNAIDAITAIRVLDNSYPGNIQVELNEDSSSLSIADNGIGLTETDIHEVLTVIGESSKRNSIDSKDYIGQFGIGLLSCFVVSDEIIFETRSSLEKPALRWCGKADGTYEVTTLDTEKPIGTKVILHPKKEWIHLFEFKTLKRNLEFYGSALPYPILLKQGDTTDPISNSNPVWLNKQASREELLAFGKEKLQSSFLDALPIQTECGKITGTIYILPFKTQFSGRLSHKIYLKRMLLSEEDCNLLPSWAFFVKCILNVEELSSTASRESLVNNDALRQARNEIGEILKNYMKGIINTNPELFSKIMEIHYLHIKAIAAEDNDMFSLFMDTLPFETNRGDRRFATIRNNYPVIYYTSDLDDFKQLRRIAASQGLLVINAAYTFDESLLKKAARLFDLQLEKISSEHILSGFEDVSYEEHPEYEYFERRCSEILASKGCVCKLKKFAPEDTPVIYIAGFKASENKQAKADNPLNAALGAFKPKVKKAIPTLCLNTNNQLVTFFTQIEDETLFESILQILYVQSLLLGKYPVNEDEMSLFNKSLHSLIVMGMSNIFDFIKE